MRKAALPVLLGLFSLLITSAATAQSVLQSSRSFNGLTGGDDVFTAAAAAPGGGYYLAGYSSYAPTGYDIWLAKVDASLNLVASTTVNGSGNDFDAAYGVAVSSSGMVYVVGATSVAAFGMKPWIGVFDASLGVIFSTNYAVGAAPASDTNASFDAIVIEPDGNLLVVGDGYPYQGAAWSHILLTRYNTGLTVLASTTFNNGFASEYGDTLLRTAAGDIFVGGGIAPAALTSHDAWIGKFNSSLALQTSDTFAGAAGQSDSIRGITMGSNGDLYVAGAAINSGTTANIWLARYTTNLVRVSSRAISGDAATSAHAGDIATGASGAVIIGGSLSQTGQNQDLLLGEIYENDLTTKSTGTVTSAGSNIDIGYAVVVNTAAGSALLAGSINGTGLDGWVGLFSVSVASAPGPSAPSAFAGTAQSASAILWSWTDNASNETGYRVLSGTINISGDLAANTTSWSQGSLAANTSYGPYAAQAYNSTGTANSSTASRYTLASVPTGLAASGVTSSSATITWSGAGTTYQLERSTGTGFVVVQTSATTSFGNTGLAAAATYFYRVAALNGDAVASAYASSITVVTLPTAPTAPSGFSGAPLSASVINWTWTDNATNEGGYRVMSGTVNISGNLPAGTVSWSQTGLAASTSYGPYSVQAFNAGGTSNSGTASQTTLSAGSGFNGAGNSDDWFYAAAAVPGGGYYLAGFSNSAATSDDIWLVKTDASLNLVSSTTFSGSGGGLDRAYGLAVSAAGEVYVVGGTSIAAFGMKPWIGRYSSSLALLSSTTFDGGAAIPGDNSAGFYAVTLEPSGDLLVAGNAYPYPGAPWGTIILGRYSPTLVKLATTTYGLGFGTEYGASVFRSTSGDIYVGGGVAPAALTSHDAWLGKFNSSLAIQTSVTFAGAAGHSDSIRGIAMGENGDLYVAGAVINSGVSADLWLARYTTNLVRLSSFSVAGTAGGTDAGYAIKAAYTGTFVVGGSNGPSGQGQNAYLSMIREDLTLKSSASYAGSGTSVDIGHAVVIDTTTNVAMLAGITDGASVDGWAGLFTLTPPAPPTAPSSFTAVILSTYSLRWTWTDNASNELGYRVMSGTINLSGDLAANTTSWLQSGLSSATLYGPYVARAFNLDGATDSSASSQTTASIALPPTAASGFVGVAQSTHSLLWSWTDNASNELGYRVMSGTVNISGDLAANTTSWLQTGLSSSTLYGPYFARVFNSTGTADSSASSQTTSAIPPAPAAPTSFSGAALSPTAILWTWLDNASNETAYRVISGTVNLSGDLSVSASSWTQTGLTPDASYGPYFARALNSGGAADSSSGTRRTLAAAPTATAVSSFTATVTTISWSANGNPATTAAEVHRSTDNAAFALFYTSAATSMRDASLLGCTSYYYKVRYVNGDAVNTAFDSTVLVRTADTVPAPPASLSAESIAGGRVALGWVGSPTEGVTGYRLFSDGGTGVFNFGAPTAVFTSTETTYTTGVLTSSAAYSFVLRAAHRCGTVETVGVSAAAASTTTLASVRAAIKNPDSGKRINGNSVTIMAELTAGTPADVSQVRFQYRASTTAAWTDIPAANVNHPNPDLQSPYFTHWNVTIIAAGSYQLRAVARDLAGNDDPAPGAISVTVTSVAPDITENIVGGDIQKSQALNNAVTNTVATGGADANDPLTKVVLPPNALNSSTVTVTVEANPTITTAPPSGLTAVGSYLRIDLDNGQHDLSNGQTACITMSYPSSGVDPSRLSIYSYDNASSRWTKDFNSTVNTSSRTITGCTPHFSIFAVFAGVATTTMLDSVRVYPNPYKPNSGDTDTGKPFTAGDVTSGIIFDNLPAVVVIEIYSLTGRKVARFDTTASGGLIRWDSRNTDGRDVASGGYFAVISSPGLKSTVKKLIIIR